MSAEQPPRLAIGIAIGNSSSAIAHTSAEGKTEVIANEEGDRQIPAVLSYVDGEEYYGTQAKSQLVRNSKNTIAYFRDFLGKDFQSIDPSNCHTSAHPHALDGSVAFSVRDSAASESANAVSVSEAMTRQIRRLRTSASDFLGSNVNAAVITVPTDFSDAQRAALAAAATHAGVDALQLVHEPVAALLAYDARDQHQHAGPQDKLVAVADFGGTRSDVAIVAARGGIYTVLATAHDFELGGAQLDGVLVEHFAKEFVKKHKDTDPRADERGLAKLRLEAEAVKKALSIGSNAAFSVESLVAGIDYTSNINRTRYELLANPTFAKFTALIQHAVAKAQLDSLDVSQVILSGGTSHTPKIARLVAELFPQASVQAPATSTTAINPAELSVRGAAIQASLIEEFETQDIEQSTHPGVTATPHLQAAVGVELATAGNGEESKTVFTPLLPAETALPARRSAQFAVPAGGADVLVRIAEGVREIKVEKPQVQPKQEEAKEKEGDNKGEGDGEESDLDVDEEDEEPEETREVVWKTTKPLAESAIRGAKAGGKVEVTVSIDARLVTQVAVREVGGQGGVRGVVGGDSA